MLLRLGLSVNFNHRLLLCNFKFFSLLLIQWLNKIISSKSSFIFCDNSAQTVEFIELIHYMYTRPGLILATLRCVNVENSLPESNPCFTLNKQQTLHSDLQRKYATMETHQQPLNNNDGSLARALILSFV